ncbi:uncharacterized protein LOC134801366 [Cydia splendana]|uniref:uncharacterized protein LOC134801366 n=1 Tax=Cydia splendana TaxID=1100963 RepID=UPI00300CFF91
MTEEQIDRLFEKVKGEMESQTEKILDRMDTKLQPIIEENKQLKLKVENLEKKVEFLDREKRNNNIIIHGLQEDEKSTGQLLQNVKTILKDYKIMVEDHEINKIHRIGKEARDEKSRPILLGLVSNRKKGEIMRNKKKSKKLYMSEDYSREIMEKRKELQSKLIEERNKGNIAYLLQDKLIIKENTNTKEKNDKWKRQPSTSPQTEYQPRKQPTLNTQKTSSANAYDVLRARSNTLNSRPSLQQNFEITRKVVNYSTNLIGLKVNSSLFVHAKSAGNDPKIKVALKLFEA